MTRYASRTRVPAKQSRAEVERILERYGATGFMYGWQAERAMIGFEYENRAVKIMLPMDVDTDQEERQRWRALVLVVKAKLEAVESGIRTFEQEFAMDFVMPDGRTVGQWIQPQLADMRERGEMPPMLEDLKEGRR